MSVLSFHCLAILTLKCTAYSSLLGNMHELKCPGGQAMPPWFLLVVQQFWTSMGQRIRPCQVRGKRHTPALGILLTGFHNKVSKDQPNSHSTTPYLWFNSNLKYRSWSEPFVESLYSHVSNNIKNGNL